MSAETSESMDEVLDLVERVEHGDPTTNALLAAQRIARSGFLLIGTPDPQGTYMPTHQTYYDKDLDMDLYHTDDPELPLTQVTWAGSLALACALLGDFNVPNHRQLIGRPLTKRRCTYGWKTTRLMYTNVEEDGSYAPPFDEEEVYLQLHAERELLQAIKRGGSSVKGSIEIFDGNPDIFQTMIQPITGDDVPPNKTHYVVRPGIIITHEPITAVATMPVSGPDLWLTNISSEEYDT